MIRLQVSEIVRLVPRDRQTLLFSATMTEEVKELAALSLQRPVRLAADPMHSMPSKLAQEVVRVKVQLGLLPTSLNTARCAVSIHAPCPSTFKSDSMQDAHIKEAVLLALCSRNFGTGRTIVFFQTKQHAHRAKLLFGLCQLSIAGELHGNMTQASRLESLDKFRKASAGSNEPAATAPHPRQIEALMVYLPSRGKWLSSLPQMLQPEVSTSWEFRLSSTLMHPQRWPAIFTGLAAQHEQVGLRGHIDHYAVGLQLCCMSHTLVPCL